MDCKLDLIVSFFLYVGVFLESRVTNAKVSRPYFLSSVDPICKHTDTNCGLDIEKLLFQFVRVWFTNDATSWSSLCVQRWKRQKRNRYEELANNSCSTVESLMLLQHQCFFSLWITRSVTVNQCVWTEGILSLLIHMSFFVIDSLYIRCARDLLVSPLHLTLAPLNTCSDHPTVQVPVSVAHWVRTLYTYILNILSIAF